LLRYPDPVDRRLRTFAQGRFEAGRVLAERTFMKLPTNTKPWIQGAVVGAVATAIIGFSWGGWVTGGSADKRAAVASRDATVVALASICADRFGAQADAPAKLVELAKANSWERGNVIERSGFALMPGNKAVDSDVARACAERLAAAATPKT
jgi:hypothetical protein